MNKALTFTKIDQGLVHPTSKVLTLAEVVAKGGRARWEGISPEARSKAMKLVRKGVKKKKRG